MTALRCMICGQFVSRTEKHECPVGINIEPPEDDDITWPMEICKKCDKPIDLEGGMIQIETYPESKGILDISPEDEMDGWYHPECAGMKCGPDGCFVPDDKDIEVKATQENLKYLESIQCEECKFMLGSDTDEKFPEVPKYKRYAGQSVGKPPNRIYHQLVTGTKTACGLDA